MSVTIRLLAPTDSVGDLTRLLHEAYGSLGEMGLNYTAVDQDEATTLRRIRRGECVIAELDDRIIGTVTWYTPRTFESCAWYRRPDVAVLGQFAVQPQRQRSGVGSLLLSDVEKRARRAGASELALDTAAPATHLIEYYAHRGFTEVETAQWNGKTYRSVIMSKTLKGA